MIDKPQQDKEEKSVMADNYNPVPNHGKTQKMFSLKQIADMAKSQLAEALGKKSNATVSIEKTQDGWRADVEIVEEEYLPGKNLMSMNDILSIYEVELSIQGELVRWSKKKSRKRGYSS